MKICAISDTHCHHDKLVIPECDLLLHSGDFTSMGRVSEIYSFFEWAASIDVKNIVVCPGNHDIMFEDQWPFALKTISSALPPHIMQAGAEEKKAVFNLTDTDVTITILNQGVTTIDGLKIWGEPRTPAFGDGWAFNVSRGAKSIWGEMPSDIDLLLAHGPPLGCGDVVRRDDSMIHVGCYDLAERIKKDTVLKTVVCGHIHEGYGLYGLSGTDIYNVSNMNERYQLLNSPVEFEIG